MDWEGLFWTKTLNTRVYLVQQQEQERTGKATYLIMFFLKGENRDLFRRCDHHHHLWIWIRPRPSIKSRQKCKKCCCSDIFSQPTLSEDRLRSVLCNPANFGPLWESFVFPWHGDNNQVPRRCETLITLSYQCQLPFNLSMNHFLPYPLCDRNQGLGGIHWNSFVYSCCQVNVNVRVSVSAAMGGVVTLRSVTCSLDCEVLKVSSSLGCTHLGWLANVLVKRPFLVNLRARWFAHSWKAFSAAHCSSFNEIGSPVLL